MKYEENLSDEKDNGSEKKRKEVKENNESLRKWRGKYKWISIIREIMKECRK